MALWLAMSFSSFTAADGLVLRSFCCSASVDLDFRLTMELRSFESYAHTSLRGLSAASLGAKLAVVCPACRRNCTRSTWLASGSSSSSRLAAFRIVCFVVACWRGHCLGVVLIHQHHDERYDNLVGGGPLEDCGRLQAWVHQEDAAAQFLDVF